MDLKEPGFTCLALDVEKVGLGGWTQFRRNKVD